MKHVITLATSIIFLTACGTFNVGDSAIEKAENPEKTADEEETDEELAAKDEESDPTVVTTTTTTTTVVGGESEEKSSKRRVIAEYELVNNNPANGEFVSGNYCAGSNIRKCWIRSGFMTEYSDGTYEVSLEFWDTYDAIPYRIEKKKLDKETAFMLTDKAKAIDDTAFGYRMLWAVVIPEEKAIAVVYDWAGDGPNRQGDDMLDAFEFVEIESEGN